MINNKIKMILALIILMMATGPVWAQQVVSSGGKTSIGSLVKFVYTHRDKNEKTGIEPVSSAGVRWVGVTFNGELSDNISYILELAANNGIYEDQIYETGQTGASSPGEMANIGVRRAKIQIADLIPVTTITVGTFMPGWGEFQDRPAYEWEFVDLPIIYTSESFHSIGWQNAGASLELHPFEWININAFWVNGYFPNTDANAEGVLYDNSFDTEKAWGARVSLDYGPFKFFYGLFNEQWEENLESGPGTDDHQADAWLAGAEFKNEKLWVLFEWMELNIEDYQTKIENGENVLVDLESKGIHLSAGYDVVKDWSLLLRWEWFDPNTYDSKSTFERSRFDQLANWTVGLNYKINSNALIMVNYTIPVEEGQKVNLDGDNQKFGGKYQETENNFLRFQLQVWQ
jgi:hypothetical protein